MIVKNMKSIASSEKSPMRNTKSVNTRPKKNSLKRISEKWVSFRRADLLAKASEAERVTFRTLRTLGYKVIRQYPINTGRRIYFADLYIPALKLILEVDGNYHLEDNQKRLDRNRSSNLRRKGLRIYRILNRDAYTPDKIIKLIERAKNDKKEIK